MEVQGYPRVVRLDEPRARTVPIAGNAARRPPIALPAALRHAPLIGALALALLVRLPYLLGTDFPLGDGGLFYAMVRDVEAQGPWPLTTTYNGGALPFVYPPLAFWLTAALDMLAPLGLLGLFRLIPAGVNVAAVLAFWWAARAVAPRAATAATWAYATLPTALVWPLMGGGLTRSFGMLFGLLTVGALARLFAQGERRWVIWTGLFAGATALSHPGWTWVTLLSALPLAVASIRGVGDLRRVGAALLLAAATAAPWWAGVLLHQGAGPMLAAFGTRGDASLPAILIAAIVLAGCRLDQRFIGMAWLALLFALDPREAETAASMPVALLLGQGWALLGAAMSNRVWTTRALAAGLVCLAAWFGATGARLLLVSLSPGERESMAWVAASTPPDAAFLVVSDQRWFTDRYGEWFPVIAGRTSVGTVQGAEWLGASRFQAEMDRHRALRACGGAPSPVVCLEEWADPERPFSRVIVTLAGVAPGGNAERIALALRADDRYRVEYAGPDVTVFARVAAG